MLSYVILFIIIEHNQKACHDLLEQIQINHNKSKIETVVFH